MTPRHKIKAERFTRNDATLVPFQSPRRTKENKTSDAVQKNVTANEENVGGAVRSAPRWPVNSECVRGSQQGSVPAHN